MMEKSINRHRFVILSCLFLCFTLCLLDFSALLRSQTLGVTFLVNNFVNVVVSRKPKIDFDSCSGRYIYVHDLPNQFNEDMVKNCHSLNMWFDMCPYISNKGFGPSIEKPNEDILGQNWFNTNQFTLEIIFHNKMKEYKCLTNDSSKASLFFVPYYAGLDVSRYLWGFNITMRDAIPTSLVKLLSQRLEWKKMWGRDHFLTTGRIAWDFRRQTDEDSNWGSKFMLFPESQNMTLLTIESSFSSNDFAIPYPTYFHPCKDSEVFEWQTRMRRTIRPYLFSFAGAPRPGYNFSIRGEIIDQCLSSSTTCKFLGCYNGANKCDDPVHVMKVFERSVFCLQPSGDSYTRRSIFDSILAGCIPVFFNSRSAYRQYLWHLPRDHNKYSVYIPENGIKEKRVFINETLLRIPKHQVLAMKEEVIRLIPRIIYANPNCRLEHFEDAFDLAIKGVLQRVEKVKKKIDEGHNPTVSFA